MARRHKYSSDSRDSKPAFAVDLAKHQGFFFGSKCYWAALHDGAWLQDDCVKSRHVKIVKISALQPVCMLDAELGGLAPPMDLILAHSRTGNHAFEA